MNDDKFEIEYRSSEAYHREVYRYLYFLRPLQLTLMLLLAAVSLLNLGYFIQQGNLVSLLVPVLFLLLIWSTAMFVRRMAAMQHKRDSAEVTYRFFDDGMQILREDQKDRFVAFESFSWAHRSKNMILIMLKGREIVILPHDAFTIGTPGLLMRLLFIKGITFR